MTERLYYRDAFLKEFEARVISSEPAAEPSAESSASQPPRWKIVLDRTAFYPSSGGQPHDLGTLAGVPVVEVADAENHTVAHYMDASVAPSPVPGQVVRGEVDWPRRFDHMQQHTGQHLLSAVFIELFGFQTVSFHLGRGASTIDLQADSVVPRHIDEAERRANQLIFEDRTVSVRFGTAEELAAAGIRKDIVRHDVPPLVEVDGTLRKGILRAIEIEGVDRQPCGGTHLARTGQVGLLLIRGLERRRDVWRLEFVCGFRALAAARGDFAALGAAASLLSCGRREVAPVVEKLIEERRAQHSSAKGLEEALAGYQAHSLLTQARDGIVAAVLPDATPSYLKLLASRVVSAHGEGAPGNMAPDDGASGNAPGEGALVNDAASDEPSSQGIIVVLASASSGAIVLARSREGKRALGAVLREALTEFGGKGGGSATFAQGSLASPHRAEQLIARLKALIALG